MKSAPCMAHSHPKVTAGFQYISHPTACPHQNKKHCFPEILNHRVPVRFGYRKALKKSRLQTLAWHADFQGSELIKKKSMLFLSIPSGRLAACFQNTTPNHANHTGAPVATKTKNIVSGKSGIIASQCFLPPLQPWLNVPGARSRLAR